MNFKVGVFADGQISGEVVNEAKNALQEIALKYKCRFELSKGVSTDKKGNGATAKSIFNKDSQQENGAFLSVGGEMEL